MKIAVIGGGISGLSAAFRLRQAGNEVTVFEAASRLGGKIHSEKVDGFLVEHGPNGFLASRPSAVKLATDLGLGQRMLPADQRSNTRYIFLGKQLEALPNGPRTAFGTPILSPLGKLRALSEPFRTARAGSDDESIWDFATRRFGREVADRLIDPMVTGIYAGDAQQLSLKACFPKLDDFEALGGSVVKGAIKSRRAAKQSAKGEPQTENTKKAKPHLTSFEHGIGELVGALGARLEGCVRLGRAVTGLSRQEDRWIVDAEGLSSEAFDKVVVCTPAAHMARLLAPMVPAIEAPLLAIPYAPVAVLAMGFETARLPRPLDGFGFLVPTSARRRVLGVLWPSAMFPGRAPSGQGLIRCILGGARDPGLLELSEPDLLNVVLAELGVMMGGAMPTPTFHRLVRWPNAIPQYTIGHLGRVEQILGAAATLPGLHLASNALYGVSVPDCASRGEAVVEELMRA